LYWYWKNLKEILSEYRKDEEHQLKKKSFNGWQRSRKNLLSTFPMRGVST